MSDAKILQTILDHLTTVKDDIKKLATRIDQVENRLTSKINQVERQLTSRIDQVESKLSHQIKATDKKLTDRLDKIGKSVAFLEDDTPTREEFDDLTQRVDKIEDRYTAS